MADVFGKTCPWKGCNKKITRATGDASTGVLSVRCDSSSAVHRALAKRTKGGWTLTPDSDRESLAEIQS
jgi:hypothetical protein